MWQVISIRTNDDGTSFRVEVPAQYLNNMMDAVKDAATAGAKTIEIKKEDE
tara:strand:+ start:1973 stop:2125 length:153 start_codon:yes stop_codon:yes gene_type:complete